VSIEQARLHFTQALSRISHFWGFPKAMGAIYATLYLSASPLSLDELVEQVGVTKGAVSTNVRMLERLGMVHRHLQVGDRKDYYSAEVDFWKIIKTILREREKTEFDLALRAVQESLEMVQDDSLPPEQVQAASFYTARMQSLLKFFHTLDNLVATIMALDELRGNALERILGNRRSGDPS
jgi:DNA-binding transcriptional regulator GbsR (MarR family)